jgi:hypothetical protein
VRTVAIRADGTVDPEMDPQDKEVEVLPPNKEGEGEIREISEHQEQLDEHMETSQYLWDTEEEK